MANAAALPPCTSRLLPTLQHGSYSTKAKPTAALSPKTACQAYPGAMGAVLSPVVWQGQQCLWHGTG